MSIYADVKPIEDAIDAVTAGNDDGVIDLDALSNLMHARNETIADGLENLCKVRANHMARIDAMKSECARITERMKYLGRQIESLESYMLSLVKMSGQKKIGAGSFDVGTRRSTRVITTPDFHNPEFEKTQVVTTVDKKMLGDALKSGRDIPGAYLQVRENLAIK